LALLGQPATELTADGGDQAAGVFVTAQIDQVEFMQQAGLQLDQVQAAGEGQG
jgi:hypothetical protein